MQIDGERAQRRECGTQGLLVGLVEPGDLPSDECDPALLPVTQSRLGLVGEQQTGGAPVGGVCLTDQVSP